MSLGELILLKSQDIKSTLTSNFLAISFVIFDNLSSRRAVKIRL